MTVRGLPSGGFRASKAAEAFKAHNSMADVVETHKAGIYFEVLRSVPMGVVKGKKDVFQE